MILHTLYLDEIENKVDLLWWQKKGLSYNRTGYGRKIPTTRIVKLPGSGRWRRVYYCSYSNSRTYFV